MSLVYLVQKSFFKEIDSVAHEPYELLTLNIEEAHQGTIMEKLGNRRGELS